MWDKHQLELNRLVADLNCAGSTLTLTLNAVR